MRYSVEQSKTYAINLASRISGHPLAELTHLNTRRYYDPDEPRHAPHAASAEAMARFLRTMLDDLVQLALRNGSAVFATHLKASIKQHGSAKLTAVTLRMVEQASTLAAAAPLLEHHVGLWFRPLVSSD
jgi:hypothetical protein